MKNDQFTIREAALSDLPAIIAILADDPLGATREDASLPPLKAYRDAFHAIERDANQLLAVVVEGNHIVGTFQLSFLPGLSRKGAWRGQIEAVRVASSHRNQGLGERMFLWAIEKFRSRGCRLVQLTTDKSRPDAHRFYDRLGFEATHEGYKLKL